MKALDPKYRHEKSHGASSGHACGGHDGRPCRGCATGHPCAACRARLEEKGAGKAGGDHESEAGFTLMELLIVIGLLGALTMLVLPHLKVTKSWATDESMAPAEMMDVRRAYAAFQADCMPTFSDQTNYVRSGLAILMTTNFTGASGLTFPLAYDPKRGKGWRGPYLQSEGREDVDIGKPGQSPTNGTSAVEIPVIYDPRHDEDLSGRYYRVLRRTNDLYLVYIGEDGSLTNDSDNVEQLLGVP